jgi:diadenosine tetraphosphate (Ap4A) HIT family hydrolase
VTLTPSPAPRRGEGSVAGCEICDRYVPRYNGDNPFFIAELESGWAVLADNQHYRGRTIFVSKTCVPELHLLPPATRTRFLEEMALVAEAVFRAFAPRKLNYELLGNSVPHLHWHLFPRYKDDPNPTWPVWNDPAFIDAERQPNTDRGAVTHMRDRLRHELTALGADGHIR